MWHIFLQLFSDGETASCRCHETVLKLLFSSGTKEEEVDSSEAGKSCLDENIALRLATLGIQLEKKFGSPRDIEFAIKQVAF